MNNEPVAWIRQGKYGKPIIVQNPCYQFSYEAECAKWGDIPLYTHPTKTLTEIIEKNKPEIEKANAYIKSLEAEIEVLKADNGHYRNMAVDFLRCREPYGWHCFTKDDDCLIMNVHGASKPDDSWANIIPLYLHSPRQEQKTCKHGVDDGACKECYAEAQEK